MTRLRGAERQIERNAAREHLLDRMDHEAASPIQIGLSFFNDKQVASTNGVTRERFDALRERGSARGQRIAGYLSEREARLKPQP